MSAFLSRFKANYHGKNAWLHQLFFVDSVSPCKDVLFLHGRNLMQTVSGEPNFKTFVVSKKFGISPGPCMSSNSMAYRLQGPKSENNSTS